MSANLRHIILFYKFLPENLRKLFRGSDKTLFRLAWIHLPIRLDSSSDSSGFIFRFAWIHLPIRLDSSSDSPETFYRFGQNFFSVHIQFSRGTQQNFFNGLEIYFKALEIYFSAFEIYFQAIEIVLWHASVNFFPWIIGKAAVLTSKSICADDETSSCRKGSALVQKRNCIRGDMEKASLPMTSGERLFLFASQGRRGWLSRACGSRRQ